MCLPAGRFVYRQILADRAGDGYQPSLRIRVGKG
jgi:hypothetical protein